MVLKMRVLIATILAAITILIDNCTNTYIVYIYIYMYFFAHQYIYIYIYVWIYRMIYNFSSSLFLNLPAWRVHVPLRRRRRFKEFITPQEAITLIHHYSSTEAANLVRKCWLYTMILQTIWVCYWKCREHPIFPMVFMIIIPFLNGYFIGNILYPIFRQTHICGIHTHMYNSLTAGTC